MKITHTNNHNIEVESLTDTLSVPLVGQVGETDISGQLPPDDVLAICLGSSLSCQLRVGGLSCYWDRWR